MAILLLVVAGCKTGYQGKEVEEGLYSVPSELATDANKITGNVVSSAEDKKEDVTSTTMPAEGAFTIVDETALEEKDVEKEDKKIELPTVNVKEGEKVSFPSLPKTDADGDIIKYTFSSPLNNKGEWLTKVGDEGSYTVTITASDGKVTTTQDVMILVEGLNKAPVFEPMNDLTVEEGDRIVLKPQITDPDDDEMVITYVGWMKTATYQTDYTDAGTHYVTIQASDGKKTTSRIVKIIVENVNRLPKITTIDDNIVVKEGDLVKVSVFASDLDGDTLTYDFEKPLDKNGMWQTKVGDEGSYDLDIKVSDGMDVVTQEISLTVDRLNRAPKFDVLETNMVVTVYPDQTATVKIEPIVSDADGDTVSVTYSGWMTSSTKTVRYEDGGQYEVVVTANDGKEQTQKRVTVVVNRAPIIII